MKIKLSKKSRARQNAIRKALTTGIPLAGLFSATLFAAGCGKNPASTMGEVAAALPPSSECTPVVRGDIAPPPDQTPAQQVPAIPPTAGVPMPPPPKPQALPEKTEIYTVQSGDTLLKIARSHQTSLEILMGLNGLPREQADHLKIGQKIKVPALTTNRDNEKTSTVVAGLVAPPAEK